MTQPASIGECARLIESRDATAADLVEGALQRIAAHDSAIGSFTAITAERARKKAHAIDTLRSSGAALPKLAGVPYAVKNLFDVEGLTTLAGAKLHERNAPARNDATLVRRLDAAGAVLLGVNNMDAYAYGFTTENTHYGITHNPHDRERVAGGSSGGSAAAVAAGFACFALGSDTNGSIRVPASFCGLFGLKPTFGRLSRAGAYPFVASLDHVGPFARSAQDLAVVYDVLQGPDALDPACAQRAVQPTALKLDEGVKGLRIAVLDDYFHAWAGPDARAAVEHAAAALGAHDRATLPEAEYARAAAFVITAAESGSLYLGALRERPDEFEPLSRERLTAGALLPAHWYLRAQRFRSLFQASARRLFERYDLVLAAATPCCATRIGAETMQINGAVVPARASIGLLTQPLSLIGLPIAVAPLWADHGLPIGVQLIAPPWREDLCLRAARALELAGVARSPVSEMAS
jgi:aspartyl-tRNA(Asn)/glutamyl-tRNA(Gln) amidotransferase subunit A